MMVDKDDSLIRIHDIEDNYEGGDYRHGHSHGGGNGEDFRNYQESMKKLKHVSFVSIFFIAA